VLTADFARAFPGGAVEDSTIEAIETTLDHFDAPCRDNVGRWLTLPERIEALAGGNTLRETAERILVTSARAAERLHSLPRTSDTELYERLTADRIALAAALGRKL
jgi:hypothetical protein